jgi:hypothetical protein
VESATGPATVVLQREHGKADLEVLCRLRPDDGGWPILSLTRGQTGRSQTFSKTVKPGLSNIQAAGVRGRWPRF